MTTGLTVLWALRSPCNLGCDYCYFGTLDDDRGGPPVTGPGVLSHLPHGDLPASALAAFLDTAARSRISRVFLAGGEPLIWPGTAQVIRTLAAAGVEVVVCSNGLPLRRPSVRRLVVEHTSAVSVSLDSADPQLNDLHRRPRRAGDGWHGVVDGIRAVVAEHRDRLRVGIYTVVSRLTLPGLLDTARLAAELGADYFVAQPISLAPDHPLYPELALGAADASAVGDALSAVAEAGLPLELPAASYPAQVQSALRYDRQTVRGCFGGSDLAFIEPDGTVWDCPSRHRIGADAAIGRVRRITGTDAATLFPPTSRPVPADCPLFSDDCVNMWPLVGDFDRFLGTGNQT